MISLSRVVGVFLLMAIVYGCASLKQNALYEQEPAQAPIFYNSSEIYSDYNITGGWFSPAPGCFEGQFTKEAAYKGEMGIDIKWDKIKEGCPWQGFGFGWDNWTGKDLSAIKNIAAIEFYVRMPEGERSGLPWAVGLEDFTGAQAWLGTTSETIKAEKITTEWTRVELPISEFNWEEFEADPSNIKQIIFNTEADGHMYVDEIEIVPYSGGFRQRANIQQLHEGQFAVDGKTDDDLWKTQAYTFGSNEVHLAIIGEFLCVAVKAKDETPLENDKSGKDIWNGDAFEIAFGTSYKVSPRRRYLMSSDRHLGFALSNSGIKTWNWRTEKELNHKECKATKTREGYVFEAKIKLAEIGFQHFEEGMLYGLEMAVDHGTEKGRNKQERWNKPENEGFNENPSIWGEMYILPKEQLTTLKN